MDRSDIEGDAIAIYHLAGLHASEPTGIGQLVRKLLGHPIETAPMVSFGRAALVRIQGAWRIYVRRGTPLPRLRFDVAHELAHWWHKRIGYEGEDIESRCDALGAALVAPRPLFVAVRRTVEEPAEIATAIGATQSLAVLREGEVLGRPVALVQPHRILVRGDAWGWPPETHLRRIARTGRPELVRVRITDEAKRVGLMAAA